MISRKVSRGALPPATLYKITGRGDQAQGRRRAAADGHRRRRLHARRERHSAGALAGRPGQGRRPRHRQAAPRRGPRRRSSSSPATSFLNRDENAITFVGYMDVDREAELVYVTRSGGTVWRYHGETGEGGPLPIKAVDLAIGPGGDVYTWGTTGSYDGPDRPLHPRPEARPAGRRPASTPSATSTAGPAAAPASAAWTSMPRAGSTPPSAPTTATSASTTPRASWSISRARRRPRRREGERGAGGHHRRHRLRRQHPRRSRPATSTCCRPGVPEGLPRRRPATRRTKPSATPWAPSTSSRRPAARCRPRTAS